MRREDGLGMVGVIVLIIVIMTLVSAGIYFARLKIEEAHVETIKTNMLKINWKVVELLEKATAEGKDADLIGTTLDKIKDSKEVKNLVESNIIPEEEYSKYYTLTDLDIFRLGITNITNEPDSFYIVNYETHEVLISIGCKYNGKDVVYKLSDCKKDNEENNMPAPAQQ